MNVEPDPKHTPFSPGRIKPFNEVMAARRAAKSPRLDNQSAVVVNVTEICPTCEQPAPVEDSRRSCPRCDRRGRRLIDLKTEAMTEYGPLLSNTGDEAVCKLLYWIREKIGPVNVRRERAVSRYVQTKEEILERERQINQEKRENDCTEKTFDELARLLIAKGAFRDNGRTIASNILYASSIDVVLEKLLAVVGEKADGDGNRSDNKAPKATQADLFERVCDELKPAGARIFKVLCMSRHATNFDTLAENRTLWKVDRPTDDAIEKALKRLRENLDKHYPEFGVTLEISAAKRTAKLTFRQTERGTKNGT